MGPIPKIDSEFVKTKLYWDLYDACMEAARKNPGPGAEQATPWIHLNDCVARRTVSPMEAMDAISLGYVPENLRARDSAYSHLL